MKSEPETLFAAVETEERLKVPYPFSRTTLFFLTEVQFFCLQSNPEANEIDRQHMIFVLSTTH
jgi:hypothetical protein